MKKILILGLNNSIWLRSYLKNVFDRRDRDDQIVVFGEYDSKLFDLCQKEGFTFIYPKSVPKALLSIPLIRGLAYRFAYYQRLLQISRKYRPDAVHIHYVNQAKLKASRIFRKKADRIVCTFWGSDLLRKSEKLLKEESKYFKYIDTFTFATDEMRRFFCEKFGDSYRGKTFIVRFGIETLEEIDKLGGQTNECKKAFGFPLDKRVITVGYNGSRSQQHLKVFDVLNSLSEDALQKIFVVIPMQYGIETGYQKEVEDYLQDARFEFRIISDFTDTRETAILRVASDCFIHSQLSDAFSASVQEYLYAQKIVFNPSWLSYPLIKDNGGFYYEYDSFDALKEMINEYISNLSEDQYKNQLQRNRQIISDLSSWKNQKDRWLQLYKKD